MSFFKSRIFHFLFILFLLPLLVCAPAAQGKQKFVAVIITGDLPRYREAHEAFLKVLRAGGLSEEKVEIYVQTPNPDTMSWANSIRKAVGVGADLIVTYGAPAALAAKKEARGVPVLFADVYDPVALGIVKDLAVPGGDITGVSGKTPLETLLKAYREIHSPKKIGALFSSDDRGSVLQLEHLEALARAQGIAVVRKDVKRADDLSGALGALAGESDSLFVAESTVLALRLREIVDFSAQKGIPVFSQIPGLCEMGGLITLEADPGEQGQLVAVYAIQVLSGKKAHTLPVFTPKKVALVINMKAAERLNLKVPFQALSLATRVIK
jgi:putative ABC transport system substrate-binding protein